MSLLVRLAIYAAILAALAWGAHMVMEHWREQGRIEVHAELDPQLAQQTKRAVDALAANKTLAADLAALHDAVKRQEAEIATFKARALQAEIAARKAMLAAAQSAAKYTSEIARLTAIAGAPTITEENCVEARSILSRLAADRVRE